MDRAPGRAVRILRAVTAGRPSDDPEASGRLLFALGARGRRPAAARPPRAAGPLRRGRGTWAVGARNLVEGGRARSSRLSATPLGDPAGTPILFPGVLSVMVRVFGPRSGRSAFRRRSSASSAPSSLERIVRRGWGQPAGHLAGAFAALFPPLVSASRVATVEPTLVDARPRRDHLRPPRLRGGHPVRGRARRASSSASASSRRATPSASSCCRSSSRSSRGRTSSRLGRTKRSLALPRRRLRPVGGSQLFAVLLPRPDDVRVPARDGLRGVRGRGPRRGAPDGVRRGPLTILSPALLLPAAHAPRRRLPVARRRRGRDRLRRDRRRPPARARRPLGRLLRRARRRRRRGGALRLSRSRSCPPSRRSRASGRRAVVVSARARTSSRDAARRGGRAGRAPRPRRRRVGAPIRHELLTHRTGAREIADADRARPSRRSPPRAVAFRAPSPRRSSSSSSGRALVGRRRDARRSLEAEARAARVRCWIWRETDAGAAAPPAEAKAWLAAHARDVTAEVDARAGRTTGSASSSPVVAASRP